MPLPLGAGAGPTAAVVTRPHVGASSCRPQPDHPDGERRPTGWRDRRPIARITRHGATLVRPLLQVRRRCAGTRTLGPRTTARDVAQSRRRRVADDAVAPSERRGVDHTGTRDRRRYECEHRVPDQETLQHRRAAHLRLTRRPPADDQRTVISETHLRPRKAMRFAHRARISYATTQRLAD